MKKIVLGLIIILFGVGIVQMIFLKHNKDIDNNNIINENMSNKIEKNKDTATNFELDNINGKSVALDDFKGKYILLNFWASWCPPCREEMPDLEKLQEENKSDDNFKILTVNVGENKETVSKFLKENKYTFEVLLDKNTDVSMDYSAYALPTTVLIDREGKIKKIISGAMNFETMKSAKEMLVNNEF